MQQAITALGLSKSLAIQRCEPGTAWSLNGRRRGNANCKPATELLMGCSNTSLLPFHCPHVAMSLCTDQLRILHGGSTTFYQGLSADRQKHLLPATRKRDRRQAGFELRNLPTLWTLSGKFLKPQGGSGPLDHSPNSPRGWGSRG